MTRILLRLFTLIILSALSLNLSAQGKILFDATKAQMAGNADWVIDADLWNIGFNSSGAAVPGLGNESNPAKLPTPAQSGINSSTAETYWKGALSAWAVSMVKLGYTVETLPYNGQITYGNSANPQDLSNYQVFVVCEPNIVFSWAEKTAILQWVQAGGGLFIISDHDSSDRNGDGWDSPHIWNDLMANNSMGNNPFGITFDYQNFSQTTSNRITATTNKILNGTQGAVAQIQFSNGTSMTINPSANNSVKGLFWKTGVTKNNYNIMLAQANYGAGRVVALGDSSPADDGTGDPNDALYNGFTGDASGNHKKMFLNATIWLAGNAGPIAAPETADDQAVNFRDEQQQTAMPVVLYPNPVRDVLTVQGLDAGQNNTLTVVDASGNVCLTQTVSGTAYASLDANRLGSGIYALLICNSQERKAFKFAKVD